LISVARNDQPPFLGSPAFWNFVADQQADPVVRRLQEQVGSELQGQPRDSQDASTAFQAA
jgi:hypothetical protein